MTEETNSNRQYCVTCDYDGIKEFITIGKWEECVGAIYNKFTDIFDAEGDGAERTCLTGFKHTANYGGYECYIQALTTRNDEKKPIVTEINTIGSFTVIPIDNDYMWAKTRRRSA